MPGPRYLPGRTPLYVRVIPCTLEYLCSYFHEWACLEPQRQVETRGTFQRRVYDILRTTCTVATKPREVRIMQLQPTIDWPLVWGNIHNVLLPDSAGSAWYMVIHDIITTNVRLDRIRLMEAENCAKCGRQDTILHRLTNVG
jgi:hypothetical protein